MHLERLTESESRVIGEALRAAVDGPFFPDWEFRRIADEWPLVVRPPEDICALLALAYSRSRADTAPVMWSAH